MPTASRPCARHDGSSIYLGTNPRRPSSLASQCARECSVTPGLMTNTSPMRKLRSPSSIAL
eukprot:scaffold513_cov22-Tisochrysis_lutea.AAC.4